MDISLLFKAQGMLRTFAENHPKFILFLKAAQSCMVEGSVLEVRVTAPDGRVLESNLKLTASDMQLVQELKNLRGAGKG